MIEYDISIERCREITGDHSPSISQIRHSFDKMTSEEQKTVITNVKIELAKEEAAKRNNLFHRREDWNCNKLFWTNKIKNNSRLIKSKKATLRRFKG